MANKKGTIPSQLQHYMEQVNIVPELSTDILNEIALQVVDKVEQDLKTTQQWRTLMNEAVKVAKQIKEGKSYPWSGAANVKYPLILTSCVQFNARTNPEIVQGDKVVNVAVMTNFQQQGQNGQEGQQQLTEDRADRLSQHMSYQLLGQSDNWRTDTDKLLMILPMLGTVFRKSYFDPIEKRPQIDLCLPNDIIIDNNISSLAKAQAITHRLHLSTNEVLEKMRAGLYETYSLDELGICQDKTPQFTNVGQDRNPINTGLTDKGEEESTTELSLFYEQQLYFDLDGDGYKEPYITVVHPHSNKVLRLVANYDEDSFIFSDYSSEVVKIKPIEYYTDFHFIPAPDGTFLSMGYGMMLYPINETVNSILNQILDASNLSNLQAGWISDALRIPKGKTRFKPGEFKQIRVPGGTRIADHIMPLPVNPPNPALFNTLEFLITAGEKIGGVTDVLLGQQPPANTPATTVMATIEQGTKVYSSMLYRLYSSFKKEFEKLFKINRKYLAETETFVSATASGIIELADYQQDSYGVFPVADPTMSSGALKLALAQALMNLREADPEVDGYEITKRYLEALKVPDIDAILPEEAKDPPPTAEEKLAEAKMKNVQADTQHKRMQTAEILMKADETGIRLELEEKAQQADAAAKGMSGVAQKISAISSLALTEKQVGQADVAIAEKQAQILQAPVTQQQAQPSDVVQRLANVEQLMQQILGGGQQSPPGQAPGGAGPTGGPPMGGQPSPATEGGQPPMKSAEQMAPAQHVAEAEAAGEQ